MKAITLEQLETALPKFQWRDTTLLAEQVRVRLLSDCDTQITVAKHELGGLARELGVKCEETISGWRLVFVEVDSRVVVKCGVK